MINDRQSPAEESRGTILPAQRLPSVQGIESIAQEAREYAPTTDTWGFYAFSDGPVVAGGGTGGFLWFAARDEMLDFIQLGLPSWCPGPIHSSERAVIAGLEGIVAALKQRGFNESSRDRLNESLKGYAQIEWCGPFGELLSGDSIFAKEMRTWFWSNIGSSGGTGSIPDDQARRFSESLQEYGV